MRQLSIRPFEGGFFRALALIGLVLAVLAGGAAPVHADLDADCATAHADDPTTLQGALNKAALSRLSTAIASGLKTYTDGIDTDNKYQTDPPHGYFKDRDCLKRVMSDYFNNILESIKSLNTDSIIGWLFDKLNGLVNKLIEGVCTWVAQQINNLLSNVCLPLPSLGSLTFSLPSLISAKSCDGVSLSSLVSVASDYGASTNATLDLSVKDVANRYINMSRGIDAATGQPLY